MTLSSRLLTLVCLLAAILCRLSETNAQVIAPDPRLNPEGPTEADLEAEFRRAREPLRAAPEFRGTDAASHLRLAEALAHRGDLNGAVEEYHAALALQPELLDAHRGLGVIQLDRHDWAGAVESLRTTVRLAPNDGEAFYWLGRALMGVRDWSGAVTALETATTLRPDDAEAYADLGLVRMVQGQQTAASEALLVAVRLKPDHAEVHRLLEILHTFEKEPAQIAREAKQILDLIFARE